MEQLYYYKSKQRKLHTWLLIISFCLLILSVIISLIDKRFSVNTIFLMVLSISYLLQFLYHRRWYLKVDRESMYIRTFPILRPRQIKYVDILSYKTLVTGDLKLQLKNKEVEISKDIFEEADFEEIKQTITLKTP